MDIVISLLVVVALLGLLLFLRLTSKKNQERPPTTRLHTDQPEQTFHAVSIVYAQNSCQAAKDFEGRRFLSSAAPKLPLAECDVMECKCRFAHHQDRRKGSDRRNPYVNQFVGSETGAHKTEQRKIKERRRQPPDKF